MDVNNVNPVSRTESMAAVRRQSQSRERRRFPQPQVRNDDSETEPLAENGIGTPEDDSYGLSCDDERAILSEVQADLLRWPATVATRALRLHEGKDGNYS